MIESSASASTRDRRRIGLVGGLTVALFLACSPFAAGASPATAAPPATVVPATVWHGAQDLAVYALGLIGVDYRFGGTTPEHGLDCSGLVRYVFQQVTGVTLPRTSQELSRIGETITMGELKPGDLVFFNTRRLQFSHVGIYIGEDRFIHAPRRGGEVEVVTLSKDYWRKRFDGARRLVGALPDLIPAAEAETIQVDSAPDAAAASEGAVAVDPSATAKSIP
jgi:hypothetical protein